VARPSGCRIEIRLDACLEPWKNSQVVSDPGKSVETILDAADMKVRATVYLWNPSMT